MKNSSKKGLWAGLSTAVVAAAAAITVTAASASAAETLYGDANCDGIVDIADATVILQYIGNADKYKLSAQGEDNADVYNRGDGITAMDSLAIQKYDAKVIPELPESWKDQQPDPAADVTYIHLNGASASVEGENAAVEGSVVTISHSGSFYVDGTLDDGQIAVNIPDETVDAGTVKIFLNNANINGRSAPAIYVINAENTSVNIVDGTVNTISDGDTAYAGDFLGKAVIEAKDDITFKGGELGTGVINITANTQDAVSCNNDIKFTGGTVNIDTLNSTDKTDAVKGKTSVTVKDTAVVNIDAEGDGLKSSKGSVAIEGGNVSVKAGNDAIQAQTTIDISGGTVLGGGDRGLTAVDGISITGGTVIVTATDNQADTAIMSGTTQGTMVMNFVASSETDGCWKKANALQGAGINEEYWIKKYAYAVISSPEIKAGGTYNFTNVFAVAAATVNGSVDFIQTGTVTIYDNVDPTGDKTSMPVPPTDGTYTVTLSGASIQSDAPAEVASVENNKLTITQPGTFSVAGEAKEVQIVVNVDKTAYPDGVVELDLVGADITNTTTSPIYVQSVGDEVQIVAKSGTVNTISDGTAHNETYTDSDGNVNTVEGAIFARDDIKFKGTGSLTVNGNTDDAIVCKNDVKIFNGSLTVNAVDDGIRGKDSVTIGNSKDTDFSTLNLVVKTQQGDGIKSTATDTAADKSYGIVTINGGTVDISSYADGIQAEQDFVMNGGELSIYTYQGSGFTASGSTGSTGGNQGGPGGWGGMGGGMQDGNSNKTDISAKGIKAVGLYDAAGTTYQSGGNITVNGGTIIVDSSDDSLHCAGQLSIQGGNLKLSSADDAVHSDSDVILGKQGGAAADFNIYVPKCYEGIEGNNIYQKSGTVIVKADDDGYNAAGGSDSSGNGNNMGWGQGGWGGGMSAGSNIIEITGGIAICQSASGDHDAFDSNGSITMSGGVIIANGQECIDCDGTKNTSGSVTAECSSQGNGSIAANTLFTIADGSGNIVVSFTTMQAMGSPSLNVSGYSCYTGGTVSGTNLIQTDDNVKVYADGTITGGTAVSAGSGNQNPWGGR
ncbi:MAG: carbohydrate-binding domain-containing protein [Alistipes sp.]|nr:carbohydrate-binding domain-containing protein [Alistipes sp.]